MTPEERERFQQRMRKSSGFGRSTVESKEQCIRIDSAQGNAVWEPDFMIRLAKQFMCLTEWHTKILRGGW
jgi:hypothetical protein